MTKEPDAAQRRRADVIRSLGGRCYNCRSVVDLELHHRHQFTPGRPMTWWERVREAEMSPQHFALLCRVCHENLHTRLLRMKHGIVNPASFMDKKSAWKAAQKSLQPEQKERVSRELAYAVKVHGLA